ANFEAEEIKRSNIPSLKVGYTQVFGYYIEITNAHKEKIPAGYVRKQTLKNAERYITPELKDFETQVLNAEDRLKDLEYEAFQKVRDRVPEEIAELPQTARPLAFPAAASSLAQVAVENKYVMPEIDDTTAFDVRDARHPVLEAVIEEKVVPNDVVLTPDKPV